MSPERNLSLIIEETNPITNGLCNNNNNNNINIKKHNIRYYRIKVTYMDICQIKSILICLNNNGLYQ